MQAVILAAGRGKRMRHLTKDTSKTMLKIKGKPLLEHKILALPRSIKEIVLVIGYQGDEIMRHFKRFFDGRRIIYVFQTNLNGSGGALHLARSVLDEKFLVIMGDDLYCKKDLNNLIKNDLAILGYEMEDARNFGLIRTNNRRHMVDVIEKPKRIIAGLVNTGAYVINKKFFNYDLVSIGNGEFGLPQTLAKMAQEHKIRIEKSTLWHPIATPEDLEKAEEIVHRFY